MSASSPNETSGAKGKVSAYFAELFGSGPPLQRQDRGKYAALVVAAVLVFFVLFGALSVPADADAGRGAGLELWIRILTALGGALLTPVTVQLFIAWVDEAKKPAQTAEFVGTLFEQSDGKIFDTVTDQTRGNFLKNILVSQTRNKGGDYGTDLGDGLVGFYFSEDQTHRGPFTYEITYRPFAGIGEKPSPALSAFAKGIAERSAHYHWIDQTIRFTQHGIKAGDLQDVVVRLAFDDETLRKLLGDRDLIFREVIHLLPEEQDELSKLDNDQLAHFVHDVLKFEAMLGESEEKAKQEHLTVTWAKLSEQRCIEIRINNPNPVTDHLVIRLAFRYPNRRSVTHFIVSAPRPVKQARITLSGTDAMEGLSYFPFVTQFGTTPYTDLVTPTRITIESAPGRWWFPTSGFVFVWNAEVHPPLPEALNGTNGRPRKAADAPKP